MNLYSINYVLFKYKKEFFEKLGFITVFASNNWRKMNKEPIKAEEEEDFEIFLVAL